MILMTSVNSVGEQNDPLVSSENARLTSVMTQYAKFIDYQPDEHMKDILLDAEHCADRYTNDDFLDHLLNAEAYRQKDQLAFNDKILYELNVPLGEQMLPVALRNSDLGKALFIGLEWGIEWQLYSCTLQWWINDVVTTMMQQRKEYITVLQAVHDSFEKGDDQALKKAVDQLHGIVYVTHGKDFVMRLAHDLLPVVATCLCLGHAFELLKKYYLLDRTYAQNILVLAVTSLLGLKKFDVQKPISVIELVEGNWVAGMPLTVLRTSVLEQVNNFLQQCGVMPAWSSGSMFLFARRVAFWLLFMRWSITSFLQPKLFEHIMNNHQNILATLRDMPEGQARGGAASQESLKQTVKLGYASMFPHWLAFKAEKYSAWQTLINIVIMAPAAVWLVRKIYNMVQQFNKQNTEGVALPAGVDQGGAS